MSYDAIVVGAGVAGAASAWFTARRGLRVALVDKTKFPRDKVCTSTVNPRSCTYLQQVGALERLAADELVPIRGLQTFSYEGKVFKAYYEPSGPHLNYGHTIPRHRLDAELLDSVLEQTDIEFFEQFEVVEVETGRDGAVVTGRHDAQEVTLRGKVVIDAAGRGSPICRSRGLFEPMDEHRRFAAMAQFSGVAWSDPLFTVGTNESIGPGYFCVFPISGDRVILSLIVTERDWARLRSDPSAELERFAAGEWILREWFDGARRETDGVAFGPLAFSNRVVTLERILMVGDTTGFYDPLTGEGITFAFRSGELAAEVVSRVTGGTAWSEAADWYASRVHEEKDEALAHARSLQRMLKLPGAFNRFVARLAEHQEAANWLARALGNLLPAGERSLAHFSRVLDRTTEEVPS